MVTPRNGGPWECWPGTNFCFKIFMFRHLAKQSYALLFIAALYWVSVQFNSAWPDLPQSTIISWLRGAVNVSEWISAGKLPDIGLSGTREQRCGIGWEREILRILAAIMRKMIVALPSKCNVNESKDLPNRRTVQTIMCTVEKNSIEMGSRILSNFRTKFYRAFCREIYRTLWHILQNQFYRDGSIDYSIESYRIRP